MFQLNSCFIVLLIGATSSSSLCFSSLCCGLCGETCSAPKALRAALNQGFINGGPDPVARGYFLSPETKDLLEKEVVLERSYDEENVEREAMVILGVSSLPKTVLQIAGKLLNHVRMTCH